MQLLNFAIMPAHLQIPTAAGISFVWTVILSMMRGAMGPTEEDKHDDAPAHVRSALSLSLLWLPVPCVVMHSCQTGAGDAR